MRRRLARTLPAPAILALGRLRSDVTGLVSLFVLVAITSFIFAAVPRVFTAISDDALRKTVSAANPFERNVEVSSVRQIAPGGDDPLAPVAARAAELEGAFAPELRALIRERTLGVETPRYIFVAAPGEQGPAGVVRHLTPRYLEEAGEHLRLVAGKAPASGAEPVKLPIAGEQDDAPVIEVALTRESARHLGVVPGQLVFAAPHTDDPLVRVVPLSEHSFVAFRITGLLEPVDADDPFWTFENRLRRPVIRDTETLRFVFAYGLFAREAYGDVVRAAAPLPLRYGWRYLIDSAGLTAGELGALDAEVRRLQARFGQGAASVAGATDVRTGLFAVFDRYERARDTAVSVLAVGGLGFLAVALVVVGLLAALGAERRARTIELVRNRGGSVAQVLTAQALEGLVAALPAGLLGYLAAVFFVDGRTGTLPALLVALVILATVAVLVGSAAGPARRGLRSLERDDVAIAGLSPRRLGFEALVVLLAGVGVYLLRRRGLSTEGGFDVYLALVPVLVGLAAALVVLRAYPLPMAALSWLAARRRDLVPALGFARGARQPSATTAPLVGLLLALGVAVFGAALVETMSHGESESPFYDGTLMLLSIGVAVVAAYAALVVLLSTTLTARSRARDLAYLRTLGLSSRQGLGLAAIELGPPVAVALAGGVILGIVVAALVRPELDLAQLAGVQADGIGIDLAVTALLVAGLLLVAAGAVVVAGAAARRASLTHILRAGEQ